MYAYVMQSTGQLFHESLHLKPGLWVVLVMAQVPPACKDQALHRLTADCWSVPGIVDQQTDDPRSAAPLAVPQCRPSALPTQPHSIADHRINDPQWIKELSVLPTNFQHKTCITSIYHVMSCHATPYDIRTQEDHHTVLPDPCYI